MCLDSPGTAHSKGEYHERSEYCIDGRPGLRPGDDELDSVNGGFIWIAAVVGGFAQLAPEFATRPTRLLAGSSS